MRDCNSCVQHVQGRRLNDIPSLCWSCMADRNNRLPYWESSEQVEEMSGGMEETQDLSPLQTQVGGDHYKTLTIQPVEYCIANKMDFFQKDIIKYVSRRKGDKVKRIEDLKKAKHYIDLYIEAIEQGRWE